LKKLKIIQSFSSTNEKNILSQSFGWLSKEFHLMSWVLSCLSLQKNGNPPKLYTDVAGVHFLIDQLRLPYDKIENSHNHFYQPNKHLWALSKILTYSLQTEPFIHIDGDVFLFQAFSEKIFSAPLVVQNIEVATEYYTSAQTQYMDNFTYSPECVQKDFWSGKPIKAVNAGVLGGNNLEFIHKYAYEAKQYVKKNESVLHKVDSDRFNVFFEQHLFYAMAKQEGIKIETFLQREFPDNQYTGLANFHEVPYKRKYLHMLGHFKRDEYSCLQMAAFLREHFPDGYENVLRLFKKKDLHPSLQHEWALLKNGISLSNYIDDSHTYKLQDNVTNAINQKNKRIDKPAIPHKLISDEYIKSLCNNFKYSSSIKKDFDFHKRSTISA